jgi:aspartate racemase
MKTIGIIGGLGPEATIDYYKAIISHFNGLNTEVKLNYPEIIIYSANLSHLIGLMDVKKYNEAVDYISGCIDKLRKAGADFVAISANTPHLLFDEIQAKSQLSLISIVESVRNVAEQKGLKKAGLIGTKFTMQSDFYQNVFNKSGIEIITPNLSDIELIHHKLFSEIELGIFKEETRMEILAVVQRMRATDQIDSLILGCTEFPIMFTQPEYLGIPFLNTTGIHVDAIIAECLVK